MRTLCVTACASLVLFVLGGARHASLATESGAGGLPPTAPTRGSPCAPESFVSRRDGVLLLGESTEITMRATVLCAGELEPEHIALVLDGSATMQGRPLQMMRSAAETIVEHFALADHPHRRMGVIEFRDDAVRLTGLTNSRSRVVGAIRRVEARGQAAIDQGLLAGLAMLQRGHGDAWPPGAVPIDLLILLSHGHSETGCAAARKAARQLGSLGALVVTGCVGPDCDAACMRSLASSPSYYFDVADTSTILGRLRFRASSIRPEVEELTIIESLPDDIDMVVGSADPIPVGEADGQYSWQFEAVPKDGVTVTFRIVPNRLGELATSRGGAGAFTDSFGRSGSFRFGIPRVRVLRPDAVPTPVREFERR